MNQSKIKNIFKIFVKKNAAKQKVLHDVTTLTVHSFAVCQLFVVTGVMHTHNLSQGELALYNGDAVIRCKNS